MGQKYLNLRMRRKSLQAISMQQPKTLADRDYQVSELKRQEDATVFDLKNDIDELKRALKLREKQLGAVLGLSDESESELVRL